jgi:simple sugar transport system ATP-binding protein
VTDTPQPDPSTEPLVELTGIAKTYPNGVVALRGVDVVVRAGEVHAIVGENGAGKSTLVKVLFGLERPTSGTVRLRGRQLDEHSPAEAIGSGIGMVHQHFQLVGSLSVAENLALGAEPTRWGFYQRRAARAAVRELGERHGIELDADVAVSELSIGDKQRLEILKALRGGADVLILDEPTAVLTPQEADRLLATLRQLADAGTGVVLITHKLREVMAVADVVTVLRAGRVVTHVATADTSIGELARAMVGRDVVEPERDQGVVPGDAVLELVDVSTGGGGRGRLRGVDLALRAGEIVGVAGVDGNGQDDLVDVIAGLRPVAVGSVGLGGEAIDGWSPARRRDAGIAHIAADRMSRGVAVDATIADNLAANRIGRAPLFRRGLRNESALNAAADEAIARYSIVADSATSVVGGLSGGNIQKVVVARELDDEPTVIIAAHPTRGVDLGAMAGIHEALLAARARGAAVLLVSSELDELRRLADRLIVLSDGQVTAEYDHPSGVADEELGRAMAGVT